MEEYEKQDLERQLKYLERSIDYAMAHDLDIERRIRMKKEIEDKLSGIEKPIPKEDFIF